MPTQREAHLVQCDQLEVDAAGRRNLAMALVGALGGAAFLEACSTAPAGSDGEEGTIGQAASGTSILAWVDTILLHPLPPPNTPRTAGDLATKTSVQVGATIVVAKGCGVAGDGGGGVFFWDLGGVDDGGTVIVPNGYVGASGSSGCWKRIYSGPVDVRWFGASPNGSAAENTIAFKNALAASTHVIVPATSLSPFWINGVDIPAETMLELLQGAMLTLFAPIVLSHSRARLVGRAVGENGVLGTTTANVNCGTSLAAAIDIYSTDANVGNRSIGVSGISLNITAPGVTGIRMNAPGMGAGTGLLGIDIDHVSIWGATVGIDVAGPVSISSFRNIYIENSVYSADNRLQTGIKALTGDTLTFDQFSIGDFNTQGIWIGGASGSLYFRNGVVESQVDHAPDGHDGPAKTVVAAVKIDPGGGVFVFQQCHFEGDRYGAPSSGNPASTQPAFILGSTTGQANDVYITECYFAAFYSVVHGLGWNRFVADGNTIGGCKYGLENLTGAGTYGGRWLNNQILLPTPADFVEATNTSGIELFMRELDSTNQRNTRLELNGTLNAKRLSSTLGTPLVQADFSDPTLSGWGANSWVNPLSGTDSRGSFTINCTAATSSTPTITLTFKDGAWPTAPFAMVAHSGGSNHKSVPVNWTTTPTTLTITLLETMPPMAINYTFTFMVMG